MATGSQEAGQNPTDDIEQNAPLRPETASRSIAWPDNASMAAQQQAANQMFRQNSERLQQPTSDKDDIADQEPLSIPDDPELTIVKDQGRGNYAGLKVEQAKTAVTEDTPDQGHQSASDEQELTIVKNHAGERETEQPKTSDSELTIVKNRSRGLGLTR